MTDDRTTEQGIEERSFMDYCRACKRKHRMTLKPCTSCGGGGGWTPQPVSIRVYEQCGADYACDGCYAYRDRYR